MSLLWGKAYPDHSCVSSSQLSPHRALEIIYIHDGQVSFIRDVWLPNVVSESKTLFSFSQQYPSKVDNVWLWQCTSTIQIDWEWIWKGVIEFRYEKWPSSTWQIGQRHKGAETLGQTNKQRIALFFFIVLILNDCVILSSNSVVGLLFWNFIPNAQMYYHIEMV